MSALPGNANERYDINDTIEQEMFSIGMEQFVFLVLLSVQAMQLQADSAECPTGCTETLVYTTSDANGRSVADR